MVSDKPPPALRPNDATMRATISSMTEG